MTKSRRKTIKQYRAEAREWWAANMALKTALERRTIERDNWKRLAKGSK